MSIKKILVPYTGASGKASIEAGLRIAKSCNAHLEVLHAVPDRNSLAASWLPDPGFTEEIVAGLASESGRHLESALSICADLSRQEGVAFLDHDEGIAAPSATVFSADGTLEQLLPLRARLADLVVMDAAMPERPMAYERLLKAALFRSGRPVLLVPAGKPFRFPFEKAVLGWNGSFEAARALKLSLPVLSGAKVLVYTGVEGHPPALAAAEAALYLRRHGIDAAAKQEFLDETGGAAIRRALAAFGAQLLVMGAYSREDRLRETLLGSLTGDILKDAAVPVLMVN